jgi:ubiquitin-activating enzyme E1
VFRIANSLYQEVKAEGDPENLDESTGNWMKLLAKGSSAVVSPMATIFGGIIGQEIIKATSSKYSPLKQWFFFDSEECLPSKDLTEEDCKPRNTRYDSQIAVFGNAFNEQILNLNYFLVGAGAIGCEVLKCWAMMGLGCGPKGKVDVTDMDTIEISNLNRQFLYRPGDVTKLKSEVSAKAVCSEFDHDLII